MVRIVNCPRCGGGARFSPENPYRPFCSERCRLSDLGAWADGTYTIPGEPLEDHAAIPPAHEHLTIVDISDPQVAAPATGKLK